MQIIRNLQNLNYNSQNIALTIGNFDGIHLGHQKILRFLRKISLEKNLKSALLTFEPHPLKILQQNQPNGQIYSEKVNQRIFSLSQKLKFLQQDNLIDVAFIQSFNFQLADLSAQDFIEQILVKKLKIKHLMVGYDFIFGKNRQGNCALLEISAARYGFSFQQIPAVLDSNQQTYSSTIIKKLIMAGNIQQAGKFLGKNYQVSGVIIKGRQLANNLGFATANFLPKKDLIMPKFGVYQAMVCLENKRYPAILNFGIKPTIHKLFKENSVNQPIFEVHILNFNQNIYGKKIIVELINFIREEQKFNCLEDLKQQIKQDINLSLTF